MKTHTSPILVFGMAMLLAACDNDTEIALRPAVASFALETVSYAENDSEKEIVIDLNKPAPEASTLKVKVTSDELAKFNILPAPDGELLLLDVPKGSSRVTFTIQSINNALADGDKSVAFTIHEASKALQIGPKNSMQSTWVDDERPARVAFALESSVVSESAESGSTVVLTLSHPAPGDGLVKIRFNSGNATYGTDFTTVPEAENRLISLPVLSGATQVTFVINPVNDALFKANRAMDLSIESVSSVFEKGSLSLHHLTIGDDELTGRIKSYATGSTNGWSTRREIHYALDGKIEKVEWQQSTPGTLSGQYVYHYDENGLLDRVDVSPVTYIRYIRENGRIVKEEEYDNGELDKYTLFGYDAAGNLGETAIYDRKPDGSFVFSLDFVFLYYTDGNLYKKLAYHPLKDGELVWLNTDTYENYIDAVNPFPIEIIHGLPTQTKLPSSYRHETQDNTFNYSLSYEFIDGGRLSKRIVTGSGGTNESTTYEYY